MPKPPRIALARFAHETNAFNPVPTTVDDFARAHLVEGEDLARSLRGFGVEVPGMLRWGELRGAADAIRSGGGVPVPLLSAWAIPSGPLAREAFESLRDRLLASLRAAGPVDGMVIVLHGAMTTVDCPSPESELLAALREVLGPGVPLVATFDLHAHLSPSKVAPLDALVAYHTNPHRDHHGTGARAGRIALEAARRRITPVLRYRMLPMLTGGGTTLDFGPTMAPLFLRLRALEWSGRALSAGLFMSHLWHDAPDLGWSTAVVTDGDAPRADRLADELADRLFATREVPMPTFLRVDEALDEVRRARLARALGTVCLSDVSDNVAAGGTGENTTLVRGLLEHGRGLRILAALRGGAAAVELARLPVGARVSRTLGGTLHPTLSPPLEVEGTVRAIAPHPAMGARVALDCGHVQLVVTERAPLAMKPAFYGELGLSPARADATHVKSLFHFRFYFAALARKSLVVASRGTTDFDLPLSLPLDGPVWPTTPLTDWRARDRARRAHGSGEIAASG